MINPYNEYYLSITMHKLAEMFEIAYYIEHIDVDTFSHIFINSKICHGFEVADPIIICSKSSLELLAQILNKEPKQTKLNPNISPEYWVGYVLAYTEWYLNRSFKEIITAYPCSKLLDNYFPYHEMDITHSVELIKSHLDFTSKLKILRNKHKLSQNDLANLSGIPVRTIKSYEQNTVNISNASGKNLYILSKILNCTIEDLLI